MRSSGKSLLMCSFPDNSTWESGGYMGSLKGYQRSDVYCFHTLNFLMVMFVFEKHFCFHKVLMISHSEITSSNVVFTM